MSPSLLQQGFTLMLVGMGTVFVFLTLLVGGMSLLALLAGRLTPDQPQASDALCSDEEVAAITVAIAHHRAARSDP